MFESILLGYIALGTVVLTLFVRIGEPKMSRKELFIVFLFSPITILIFVFRFISFAIESTIEYLCEIERKNLFKNK